MLANSRAVATLPAVDIDRARKFYEGKLGLRAVVANENEVQYECGKGSTIYLYKRGATKADHTALAFEVDDLEKEVKELRTRGVVFEEYNLPGLKTVNGIAELGTEKAAWFNDSEGNILGVSQRLK